MGSNLTIRDRQLALSAEQGLTHLETADWSQSARPNEEFLAVLALRLVLAGYLVGTVQRETTPDGVTVIRVQLDGKPQPEERVHAARLLLAPVQRYAELAQLSYATADTGAVPIPVLILGGAVAVVVVAAEAYAFMFVAEKAANIVDGALKRNDSSREIQRADAEVLKLVNQHVQREKAAGKTLPIDEPTKLALAALSSRVGSLLQNFQSQVSSGFPPWALPAVGLAAVAALTAVIVLRKAKQHDN